MLLEHSSRLNDSSFKGAVEVQNEVLKFQAIATNGTFLKRIFKQQPLKARFISFSFVNNPLFETFDEKIQQLFTGGFINYFDRDFKEFTNPARYEHLHAKGPEVLTMKDLKAGFVVSTVPLVFAFIAFVLEWIRRLSELVFFKCAIEAFYALRRFEN